MNRPRLTSRVLRGLATMASVAQAGACSDFLGTAPTQDDKPNADWDDVLRACDWIGGMRAWERERKGAARP